MTDTVLFTIITLSSIGVLAAIILFFVAQKFKVYEDPRIDQVSEVLPGANCGGCGQPGCRPFAEACVKADTLDDLYCPVGGNTCMADVAKVLGKVATEKPPTVAVVRCSGTPANRIHLNTYDGAPNCTIASSLYSGETECQYGCLGLGECVEACDFDAIIMNSKTGLPEVIDEKCTACGACVTACPKNIIEIRKKNKKDRKIFVSCMNHDKGGIAKKACTVACTGCTLCVKECKYDAITVTNFLAYIDSQKCVLCRKCAEVCPTGAILEVNFPERKLKAEVAEKIAEVEKAQKEKKAESLTKTE